MKILFVLIFLASTQVNAFVGNNASEGLGLEILMGGVGQARFGSNGSLTSNPSLLAWLPNEKEFVSTNTISFYKLKSETSQDIEITPDIVPRFAATSQGFGNWGHSYGVNITKMKINFDQVQDDFRVKGTQETQIINLNYGFGYKISDQSAFGISVFIGRINEDSAYSSMGDDNGVESAFTIRSKEAFWFSGASLGFASSLEGWGYGFSTKFTTMKFGATAVNDQSGYSEVNNQNSEFVDHEVGVIKLLPDFRAGIQKLFQTTKLFFDLSWVPSYTDPDFDDYNKAALTGNFGIEGLLTETYRWYSGFAYITPVNSETKADSGSLHFGLSKKGPHSMNFGGISWTRAYSNADNELIAINFGTKFDF